jgi:hypothetical protein
LNFVDNPTGKHSKLDGRSLKNAVSVVSLRHYTRGSASDPAILLAAAPRYVRLRGPDGSTHTTMFHADGLPQQDKFDFRSLPDNLRHQIIVSGSLCPYLCFYILLIPIIEPFN